MDSHIKKNQDFLDLINKFIGVFTIDIRDEDIAKMATEFVEKIKSLEKKLNVTKDIYEDFKKKLEEAHARNQDKENAHLTLQQVMELFQEDLEKMQVLFDGVIDEIHELKEKYEKPQNPAEIAQPEESDSESDSQEVQDEPQI